MTLTLCSILIAFIGALIGIFTKSWKKENAGLKKISLTGWLSLVLLFFGTLITIYTSVKANNEQKNQNENIEKVKAIAKNEISFTCMSIVFPLIKFSTGDENLKEIIDTNATCSEYAKFMTKDSAIINLSTYEFSILDPEREYSMDKLSHVFGEYNWLYNYYSSPLTDILKANLYQWSLYLKPNEIEIFQKLINHSFLSTYIKKLKPPIYCIANNDYDTSYSSLGYSLITKPDIFTDSYVQASIKDFFLLMYKLLVQIEPKTKRAIDFIREQNPRVTVNNFGYESDAPF